MPADTAGVLLDTNAMLWTIARSKRLSSRARSAISAIGDPLVVSAASLCLVAQALMEKLAIVSSDPALERYGVDVIW